MARDRTTEEESLNAAHVRCGHARFRERQRNPVLPRSIVEEQRAAAIVLNSEAEVHSNRCASLLGGTLRERYEPAAVHPTDNDFRILALRESRQRAQHD